MNFVKCSYDEFITKIKDRQVIQFGASTGWEYYASLYPNIYADVVERTDYIVDNSRDKIGTEWDVLGRRIQVKEPVRLCEEKKPLILITVGLRYQDKICRQLLDLELSEEAECYSLQLMIYGETEADNKCVSEYFDTHTEKRIPPKIHSFWFSGEDKPDKYKRCIDSWYKFCPNFEILEWNSNNYDVTKNEYMKQAFSCKKWAFVSDYARLDVVHEYGGIYLDMDVELIAPIDWIRFAAAFFCRQNDGLIELGSGFGAARKNPLVGELLSFYDDKKFLKNDGTWDMTPQPTLLSPIFNKHGMMRCHNSKVVEDIMLFSNDYITCIKGDPSSWNFKGTEVGIHWHNAGWMKENDRQALEEDFITKGRLLKNYFKSI